MLVVWHRHACTQWHRLWNVLRKNQLGITFCVATNFNSHNFITWQSILSFINNVFGLLWRSTSQKKKSHSKTSKLVFYGYSNSMWTDTIFLVKCLDFETFKAYKFALITLLTFKHGDNHFNSHTSYTKMCVVFCSSFFFIFVTRKAL